MGGSKYKSDAVRRSTKKRKFTGNRYTRKEEDVAQPDVDLMVDEDDSTTINDQAASNSSASASKIDLTFYDGIREETAEINNVNVYVYVDVGILNSILEFVGTCPTCQSKIKNELDYASRQGLAQKFKMVCCDLDCSWEHSFYTSHRMDNSKRFDLNVRGAVAFREIGRGLSHIETFNRVMNMPPPFTHSAYDEIVSSITPCYIAAMEESMATAANDVTSSSEEVLIDPSEDYNENVVDEKIEDVRKCDVSSDGSWQRRGFASLNGFVSCIERQHDKVIDVEIMSKFCRECQYWKGKEDDTHYLDWLSSHICQANHSGSSGSMETDGAVAIFNRSLSKHSLQYQNYIGDGDSSAYKRVVESKPYGNEPIGKLECVGHIQKRVGARLLKLVKENKSLSSKGEGKLTRKIINTLQNYYGMALRGSKDKTLLEMKKAIAAVLHHCTNKDGVELDERHAYCPRIESTWCKYQKSKISGEEFKVDRINIAESVYDKVRPLWIRLTDDDLLEKCRHGRTQNDNESFNAFVWKRAPKDVFIGRNIFDLSVSSSVVAFNDGAAGILKVMKKIGLNIGHFNLTSSRITDMTRINASIYKSSEKEKLSRKRRHAKKKGYDKDSDKDYGAGQH